MSVIEALANTGASFIPLLVEKWVSPKLVALLDLADSRREVLQHDVLNAFSAYLKRVCERNSYITSVVYQNQQKRLEELYVPLSVRADATAAPVVIDDYKQGFVPEFRRILLTDTAGMGKSTLMKFLFLACVRRNAGIPVFIELRQLTGTRPLFDVLWQEISGLHDPVSKDLFVRLIKRGDFVFFFDGLDEVPFSEREGVVRQIDAFVTNSRENCFIITSRPEASLLSFSDFKRFTIVPLDRPSAYKLIQKYDGSNGKLSDELIKKLRRSEVINVDEFLGNPLLVSLLFRSYQYKPKLAFKKHIFYRQVYDALFEGHDLSKAGGFERQKHSGLDIEEFHRVLRALAFATVKRGAIEYTRDELVQNLGAAKIYTSLGFREGNFVHDLTVAVPLFVHESEYFRWAHKSIQEYFAAQFIWLDSGESLAGILGRIAESPQIERYINILDLYHDMDPKGFSRYVLYPLGLRLREHCESTYRAQYGKGRDEVRPESVRERRAGTFGRRLMVTYEPLFPARRSRHQPRRAIDAAVAPEPKPTQTWVLSRRCKVLEQRSPDHVLLELLAKKQSPLVRKIEVPAEQYLDRARLVVESACLEHTQFPLEITDDPELTFNTRRVFDSLNVLLGATGEVLPVPQVFESLILKLEAETQRAATDDPLIADL